MRTAHARVRAKQLDTAAVKSAEKEVQAVSSRLALGGDLAALLPSGEERERGERVAGNTPLRKGAKVYVPRLRAEAEVVDVQTDGQLRVAAGSLKLTVTREEVRLLVDGRNADGNRTPKGATARSPRLRSSHARTGHEGDHKQRPPSGTMVAAAAADSETRDDERPIQTSENTCDLRGLRVDDAWPMLESFLDRSLNAGLAVVFVIHGHGSGALREHLREELKRSRYVGRLRSGNPSEGGEAVTVVWFA
ncbi:MAG: hypothetical protein NVS3B20_21020 [Polyangiales bacterium]